MTRTGATAGVALCDGGRSFVKGKRRRIDWAVCSCASSEISTRAFIRSTHRIVSEFRQRKSTSAALLVMRPLIEGGGVQRILQQCRQKVEFQLAARGLTPIVRVLGFSLCPRLAHNGTQTTAEDCTQK